MLTYELPESIENMKELVTDIVKKGQEIDQLIEALPGISRTEEEQVRIVWAWQVRFNINMY